MPRFYFQLRCAHEGVSPDELGLDLPDAETAYLEADRAVRDMAHELQAKGKNPWSYAFEITNGAGEVVFEVPFSETLDRRKSRQLVCLNGAVTGAVNRAERMMRLAAQIAEQTRIAQANLQRAQDLLRSRHPPTPPNWTRDHSGRENGDCLEHSIPP